MDSEEDVLVMNRSKNKRKAIVSSEEDEPEKKVKMDDSQQENIESGLDSNQKTQVKAQIDDKQKVIQQEYKKQSQEQKSKKNNQHQQNNNQKTTTTTTTQQQISKPKNNIIYDILKRWWYCMQEWPPQQFDYIGELNRKGYREVESSNWKKEQEMDRNGLQKCYWIEGYSGLYRDGYGELIDVRPMHLCPSYDNLKQKSLRELLELLMTALKNQITDYKEQDIEHIDQKYLEYLENQFQKTGKQQKALLDKISMLKQNGKQ